MAGRETGKAWAISPAGWLPRRKRSSTARRVGSARAWKVVSAIRSGKYVTERFRMMRNLTVTQRGCQEKNQRQKSRAADRSVRPTRGDQIQERLMNAGVVGEFGVESCGHHSSLPDRDGS